MLFSLIVSQESFVHASEIESDIGIRSYETYVTLNPTSQTRIGPTATARWTATHGGGNGVYNATFYYGDGISSGGRYTSTKSDWNREYRLGPNETQRSYNVRIVVSSSNSATATGTVLHKRW